MGVGLRVARADGSRRGALVQKGRGWEVVIMRRADRPAPISAHERFTIAHEIGHLVLLREARFRPQRQAEYWLCEELCNRFASRLLIPPHCVADIGEPSTAADVASAVNEVAKRAHVTAEPAARAVVAQFAASAAVGTFRLDPLRSTKRLGFRGWWTESQSWWGGRGGRRLAVYVDHALAPALLAMSDLTRGQTAAPELHGAAATFLRRRKGPVASFAALLA